MSDMFRGFYAEPPGYIPDNMHKKPIPPKSVSLVSDNLDIILDKNGNKKGYSWNYGETVSIPISVDIPVRIEFNAYYTYEVGEEPTLNTVGVPGQKFYNLTDVRSWVLTSYVPDTRSYIWTEEPRFTFPENGPKKVYVHPDMTGKYILTEFINFRGEQIAERVFDEVNEIQWTVDQPQSLAIPRGIYDLYIYVADAHRPDLVDRTEYKKLTKRYEIVVR